MRSVRTPPARLSTVIVGGKGLDFLSQSRAKHVQFSSSFNYATPPLYTPPFLPAGVSRFQGQACGFSFERTPVRIAQWRSSMLWKLVSWRKDMRAVPERPPS